MRSMIAAGLILLLGGVGVCAEKNLDLRHRWVYVSANLLVEKEVERVLQVLERAARAKYTGVVFADSKFMRWHNLPPKYAEHARKVREACRGLKMDFIPCVFPIGYSEGILAHDPNLAEGLPVVDAPFLVKDGRLVPADDGVKLVNGGFEEHRENRPTGWSLPDEPGKISFVDTEVKCEGRASLRMQDIGTHSPQHGHGRIHQLIKVRPFAYYHVSVMVKTENFEAADKVRIAVLSSPGGAPLNFYEPPIQKTQDWRRLDVVFNTLEHSEVRVYLGVWGGKGGKIWWDDARLEPAGLVNVLRRDGAPLRVRSEDGNTEYKEGVDFSEVRDPKLGNSPWPGAFSVWHEPPTVSIPKGSALKEGQRVLLSYYHPTLIHSGQVMCCMAEPKLYEILKWQAEQIYKHLAPDGYFMSHDEIRAQGWDASCAAKKMTPGQLLAENVKRCVEILDHVDPGKPIYVWSDMFDPYHNARKEGRYYLVRGDGPWYGSWEGLPQKVIVVNWHMFEKGRVESLKHFAERGHKQILAGYYDVDPARIRPWLADAAEVEGVIGVMYTTWRRNYEDMERFAAEIEKR